MMPTILMVGLGRPFSRGDRWYTGFVRTLCCCFWSEVECNGYLNYNCPPALRVWMGATRSNFLWKFVKWKQLIGPSMQEIRSLSRPGDHRASSTYRSWLRSDYYEELILPLEYRKGHLGEPVRVRKTTRIDNSLKCLGWSKRVSWGLPCLHIYHATFTPEMSADELMQRMWDEDVVGIADQNKRLTAEEVLAARKETQPRRYAEWLWSGNSMEGWWYAVVFKEKDCWRPTYL